MKIKVVSVFPSAPWINRQSRDTPVRAHDQQDFSNSCSPETCLFAIRRLRICHLCNLIIRLALFWQKFRVDRQRNYSSVYWWYFQVFHLNNSSVIPVSFQCHSSVIPVSFQRHHSICTTQRTSSNQILISFLLGKNQIGLNDWKVWKVRNKIVMFY